MEGTDHLFMSIIWFLTMTLLMQIQQFHPVLLRCLLGHPCWFEQSHCSWLSVVQRRFHNKEGAIGSCPRPNIWTAYFAYCFTHLSWKCRHFRCRPQLVLTTCLRVFPTHQPDTANVSATSCDVEFFFSVLYVVSLPNCRHVVVVTTTMYHTTSQKHRAKHLGVCRLLKIYLLKLIQKIL